LFLRILPLTEYLSSLDESCNEHLGSHFANLFHLSLSLPTRAFADLRRSWLSLLLSYELPFIPNNLCESSGSAFDLSCPDAYELPTQSLPRL
jgi:hypothetical protein